jgi:paraquat-inducible protein A
VVKFEACPDCDVLLNPISAESGSKVSCPRCGYTLERPRQQSLERTLLLSITGLILFLPANLLPMLGIQIFGNRHEGSLWSGVFALINQDMWAVALLVLLSSVILPIVNMSLAFLVSFHLYFNKPNRHLSFWLRWFQHLNEWAMLEVFALSIIVACVKLSSLADLHFGFGLYAFTALLLVNAMLANELDERLFWRLIDRQVGP